MDDSTCSQAVLCWGNTEHGQLGVGGQEEEQILTPLQLKFFDNRDVKNIASGRQHTVFVMLDGTVFSCGCNDYGQLGHEKSQRKPERIDTLETHSIQSSACGLDHSVAVNENGQVLCWGGNLHGQLGRGNTDIKFTHVPRLVKTLAQHPVRQVSCGLNHTVALSQEGKIYTWGHSQYGQLGVGPPTSSCVSSPQPVGSLCGLPVVHVAAGGSHTFALTVSGAMYGWGKNSFGQLGNGSENDSHYPVQCKSLRSQQVKFISCGQEHTAVLTKSGGVFTFGAGMYGQLGHNSTNNELLPRKVFELMGSVVTQLQCGRKHTLAYVLSTGRVYSFGQGGNGQLGTGSTSNQRSPCTVKGPFVSTSGDRSLHLITREQALFTVKEVFAGGDQTFVTASAPKLNKEPMDHRVLRLLSGMLQFSQDLLEESVKLPAVSMPPPDITAKLVNVCSSLYAWNISFLKRILTSHMDDSGPPPQWTLLQPVKRVSLSEVSAGESEDEHFNCNSSNPGICLESAVDMLSCLHSLPNRHLVANMMAALENTLIPSLGRALPDAECLRVYYTLPFHPAFRDSSNFSTIQCPFAQAVVVLEKAPAKILDKWWGNLNTDNFLHLINVYKRVVIHIIQLASPSSEYESIGRQKKILHCMQFLKKIYQVNGEGRSLVSHEEFYISDLHEHVEIRTDYVRWLQRHAKITSSTSAQADESLSFCNFPFVFDGQAKTLLLQTDAIIQMQAAVDEANRRNFSSLLLSSVDTVSPCLVLFIRRDSIVADTINQLNKQGQMDFKKPLKVMFVGEEALDAGGVKKEFFMLLLRELQDPKFGMFEYHDCSRLIWFSRETFEDAVMYSLIGALCGLAIYNATIIDLHFPLALYKKLLKKPVTLEDLREIQPSLARGFDQLLEYDGADFEDTFNLTFEITRESFGEVKTFPLIPNGGSIPVTKDNREEYIKAYLEYFFDTSVQGPFLAFYDGFHKVCGGRVLELFQPLELQSMVVGNQNYDWTELQKGAEYKGVYHANHPVIKHFWGVFHEMDDDSKKKFLLFLTGSDRVPILGMKSIKLYIQATAGGDEFLPVAHTCFNLLDLPAYTSRDTLKHKLLQAIENTEGFGLV